MRLRFAWRRRLLPIVVLALVSFGAGLVTAAEPPPPPPFPAAASPPSAAEPNAGEMMRSAGWLEHTIMKLEHEAMSDISMLPDTPSALEREWRSFDRNGSALGALIGFGWVVLAALVALAAEKLAGRCVSRRVRRNLRLRPEGPTLGGLLLLGICDLIGLAVFAGVFVLSRHALVAIDVSLTLVLFAANVLIRWRIAAMVFRALLRPGEPYARLIEVGDDEARKLTRFLSGALLLVLVLIGFGRHGLADEDSGAPHIIGLIVAALVCGINALIVYRARAAAEALIRGRSTGLFGALRGAVARAWLPIGLTAMGALMVFFVFGLSLGLLSYYHGVVSTLGLLLLLLVLESLAEKGWRDCVAAQTGGRGGVDPLVQRSLQRMLSAVVLLAAGMTLAWIWVDALEMRPADASRALYSSLAALGTLFVGYIAWELTRLAVDRNLQSVAAGPKMPGAADDEEAAPVSRLQTILPMVRAAFGIVIAIVATLIVLSHLGIDTAPLIAGAGVFGLAISFGSQSLVRDIISGLFYMWDDAFRLGEYIDTGRLKGTVEALGVRSIKLRHHNGPLHTIPYGQLGAVTNLSRDFSTIKFNLRLEPGTDIELVRKTAKRIGLDMQEDHPELAQEVMLPLKMQGLADVADNALVVRFKFTARPLKPSWVQREYLKRIYKEFSEKGIRFATGALTLQTAPPRPGFGDAEAARGMLPEPLASAAAPTPLQPAARVA